MTTKESRARRGVAGARARGNAVADRGKHWLENQEPASRQGAAIGWYRRYAASDGQLYAMLLTAYVFVTVLPVIVVIQSYLYSDSAAASSHLIKRLGLTGSSATFLSDVITGSSSNKLGVAVIAIANVLIVGLGFGRVLQLAHARSWGLDARKGVITDQLRYVASLFVLLVMVLIFLAQSKFLEGRPAWIGWVLAPVWIAGAVGYLVWLPRLLLHNRVSVRDVLPGALLATAALIGMRIISSFLLVRWLVWYSKYYGSFGVVMALFFWLLIAMTILVVAAALSPAVAERRDLRAAAAAARPRP
jgi:membrane protein